MKEIIFIIAFSWLPSLAIWNFKQENGWIVAIPVAFVYLWFLGIIIKMWLTR